ncbi:MAG TPA: Mur ligase domain-containing protein [Syntrophorhabdaceae bacterium]|nr:Mur ligase domain-containing protein [Syntrophorhabdaceae bacterium]
MGIFGTGMSALAQYLRFDGIIVSGSDRLLNTSDTESMHASLEAVGCTVTVQDGSGIRHDTDAVCVSTAIEETNPEIVAARKYQIPVIHRSDLLAAIVESKDTIAVAGTSGKSTVTAMIFELLSACGKSPSLISGAPLRRLERQGLVGNAYSGASDLLVVEADESDGTLVKYRPEISVVLNVSKDHRSIEEITEFFKILLSRSRWRITNADDPVLACVASDTTFGRTVSASWHPDREELLPMSVKLFRKGFVYDLQGPGKHSLENLRAALCVCEHLGCEEARLADAVSAFEGVSRRFTLFETGEGVYVVDDFAHNPAKISAVVEATRGFASRIIAIYQPHGYGPTRFLREEYVSAFRSIFKDNDELILLPIYYAGGTAIKDISSDDLIGDLIKSGVPFAATAVNNRSHLLSLLESKASSGDCVLLMGARDPSLPALARDICALFGGLVKNQS